MPVIAICNRGHEKNNLSLLKSNSPKGWAEN